MEKAQRGEISWGQAVALVQALLLLFEKLVETAPLAPRALELARQFDHPAYDCFYLALADSVSATLVTDDARAVELARAARRRRLAKTPAALETRGWINAVSLDRATHSCRVR